jgi:predicted O-linked N-acetylglucosamine transferase (SPINDLY family)
LVNPDTLAVLEASLTQARQAHASGDAAAAQRAYQQAHLLSPEDPALMLDLATACLNNHELNLALAHALAAEQRDPNWRTHMVLATTCQRLQRADAAAAQLQKALDQSALPTKLRIAALQQLADLQLNAFGDARSAALSLRRAADSSGHPTLVQAAELATLVCALYQGTSSAAAIAGGFSTLARGLAPVVPAVVGSRPVARQRPRIGLLSQQFCASPVGFLTLGALSALARDAELLFFDRGAKADWAQAAFKASAHCWLNCSRLDAAQLQRLLIEAELDAVIDLSGWTDPQALQALATRPVARQLKWVGGQSLSTGMTCFNGFVTDPRQVPQAAAHLYTEPLLYAHHGYVTYSAPPYAQALAGAAAQPPKPKGAPQPGLVALVSNPAKISAATRDALLKLKPRRLVLVDQRWRHEGTRLAARQQLGPLLDLAEFVTPANHPEYLAALQTLDASFLDTEPYAMGLSAIELRLLGKHIVARERSDQALMCQRHCQAHLGARRFDHHTELAAQLLQWCRA